MCGEKLDRMLHHRRMTGSPPRVRGKGAHKPVRLLDGGITPACAGKRIPQLFGASLSRDHPRVCGEKVVPIIVLCSFMGSPPRVRGKVCTVPLRPFAVGITPAYAGKSRKNGTCNRQIWDHPRVCGEELSAIGGMYYELGSPPRMRGRVIRGLATRITSGITPAYAGKSSLPMAMRWFTWDHPRVCGEKHFYSPQSTK